MSRKVQEQVEELDKASTVDQKVLCQALLSIHRVQPQNSQSLVLHLGQILAEKMKNKTELEYGQLYSL